MAIAAVMANLSRILAWWREVDWRACAAYSIPGIPAAALGARTLLALPSHAVDISIGLFRDRLHHRHRGFHRALERAAVSVLRPHQGRVSRHRSREFARALCIKIRDLSAVRRADAGCRTKRPDRRRIADVGRLHRQAVCLAARTRNVSPGHGRHHAGGGLHHVSQRLRSKPIIQEGLHEDNSVAGATAPFPGFVESALATSAGGLTTLWFRRVVARGAVKVADIPGPNNLKSFRNTIHLYFPRIFICCRKLGYAGLSAIRASKLLNPTIAGHPQICTATSKRSPKRSPCRKGGKSKIGHCEIQIRPQRVRIGQRLLPDKNILRTWVFSWCNTSGRRFLKFTFARFSGNKIPASA